MEVILPNTSTGGGLVLLEPSQLSYLSRYMLHGYPDDFERYVGVLDLGTIVSPVDLPNIYFRTQNIKGNIKVCCGYFLAHCCVSYFSLCADEGNKVWICASTDKLSQR